MRDISWIENLHACYFWGIKKLDTYFFKSLNNILFFGSYLQANVSFQVFAVISGSEKYSFQHMFQRRALESSALLSDSVSSYLSLVFFWVENFDARFFWGLKLKACVFFEFAI